MHRRNTPQNGVHAKVFLMVILVLLGVVLTPLTSSTEGPYREVNTCTFWKTSNLTVRWPTPRFSGKLTWVHGFLGSDASASFRSSIGENLTALAMRYRNNPTNVMT